MYRVYWSEHNTIRSEDIEDLGEALKATQAIRNTPGTSFVTMVAGDVPGMVGKFGATPAPEDYSWTKRRTTELRKHRNLTDEVEVPLDED